MERLYIRVKELREAKGLSTEKLAEEINIFSSTLSAYESGKKQMSVAHLLRIADYFKVTLDSLLSHGRETIHVDFQNPSFLNDYHFMLDNQPLSHDEIAEAVHFIQVKRRMRDYSISDS